jgi:hypothetical protein
MKAHNNFHIGIRGNRGRRLVSRHINMRVAREFNLVQCRLETPFKITHLTNAMNLSFGSNLNWLATSRSLNSAWNQFDIIKSGEAVIETLEPATWQCDDKTIMPRVSRNLFIEPPHLGLSFVPSSWTNHFSFLNFNLSSRLQFSKTHQENVVAISTYQCFLLRDYLAISTRSLDAFVPRVALDFRHFPFPKFP